MARKKARDEVKGGEEAAKEAAIKVRGRLSRLFGSEAREARQLVRATAAGDTDEAKAALGLMVKDMREELIGQNSYVPVFFMTLLVVVVAPLIEGSLLGQIITFGLVAATLSLALRRSPLNPANMFRLTSFVVATTALAIGATLLNHYGHSGRVAGAIAAGAFVLVFLITLPAVLLQTFLHTRVNLNTLAAAMSAYLLLGLMFTAVFGFMTIVETDQFFAQKETISPGDTEYFSFITLTTVGYGDLSPGNNLARAGAVAEAVVGQIFLVTIVARVVGAMGREQPMGELIERVRAERGIADEPTGGLEPDG